MAGVAVGVLDLTLLAAVGVPLLRRARPWRLAVAALAWALVGATVGIAVYDRVLGGVDQGPDDVTIHAD